MVKKTDFITKITEVEGKIPNISGLATSFALSAVKNKITDTSSLAATFALNAAENKILDISNMVTKTDFDAKLKAISNRVTRNKAKDLLLDNELKKLKSFDTDYIKGKSYFGNDNINYLVFEVSFHILIFMVIHWVGLFFHGTLKGYLKKLLKPLNLIIKYYLP